MKVRNLYFGTVYEALPADRFVKMVIKDTEYYFTSESGKYTCALSPEYKLKKEEIEEGYLYGYYEDEAGNLYDCTLTNTHGELVKFYKKFKKGPVIEQLKLF